MVLDIEKLVKFSTFARKHGKSIPWVSAQEAKNTIQTVRIDGVKFVIIK